MILDFIKKSLSGWRGIFGLLDEVKLFPALEELDLALMLLCGFARLERAQILALARPGILLFRVQTILARFQLSNHWNAPEHGVRNQEADVVLLATVLNF
jgi:hypothetical protein